MRSRGRSGPSGGYLVIFASAFLGGEVLRCALDRWLPGTAPFIRYALYILVCKVSGDIAAYLARPGRKEWLYLEDYVVNDIFLVYRYGFILAILQAYLAGSSLIAAHPYLAALWRTTVLDAAYYLCTRVSQDREMDEAYHPGRRSLPQGGQP